MADGGIAMDKSPSPPRMEWTKQNPSGLTPEMTGSLTDHLQRLLAIKKSTSTTEGELSKASQDDTNSDASNSIKKMLSERDEMWREHERSQIAFMEREHERTLRGLHNEIERLQLRCSELTRQLAETLTVIEGQSSASDQGTDETKLISELENQLRSTRAELSAMRELHERKQEKLLQLEERSQGQESRYQEELGQKNRQIEEISADLSHKAALVAQLTTQLHQFRLREAVEKQRYEQRRQLAEQQSKRRQALAAAKAEFSPHRSNSLGKTASPSRSHTVPAKITVQVAAEATSTPGSFHLQSQSTRKPGVRLVSTTAGTSSPVSARRTRSVALPSIMSASTPSSTEPNKPQPEPKKTGTITVKSRSMSTVTKPQGGP